MEEYKLFENKRYINSILNPMQQLGEHFSLMPLGQVYTRNELTEKPKEEKKYKLTFLPLPNSFIKLDRQLKQKRIDKNKKQMIRNARFEVHLFHFFYNQNECITKKENSVTFTSSFNSLLIVFDGSWCDQEYYVTDKIIRDDAYSTEDGRVYVRIKETPSPESTSSKPSYLILQLIDDEPSGWTIDFQCLGISSSPYD